MKKHLAQILLLPALALLCAAGGLCAPTPPPPPWASPGSLDFTDEIPVPALDAAALRRTLPLRGERLVSKNKYTILAIGDSVTSTGPYPEILARGADVILLEPTPHINITPLPGDAQPPPPEAGIFRVITFAGALRQLAARTRTPVAPTFSALWRAGAASTLRQTARNLWPYFPRHYSKPFTTIADTAGRGDTIHPNARGHALLARAVFDTIAAAPGPAEPLRVTGETKWPQENALPPLALVTTLTLANTSTLALSGTLAVYPFPQDDRHTAFTYALAPGTATARIQTDAAIIEIPVAIPTDSTVGRIPLSKIIAASDGETIRVAAELAYIRYAPARTGEAATDADLAEWPAPAPASAAVATNAEIFVPYDVLGITRWPDSGDLGLSIVWTHKHDNTLPSPPTRLMWSDNGHPWNTRWFGVVRRDPAGPLPCVTRTL